MATKEINASGGINGHPVKIQQIDSQGSAAQTATNYQAYEPKASAAVVGLSVELSAIAPVAKQDQLPVLTDGSNGQTVAAGRPYVWSLVVNTSKLSDASMAAWTQLFPGMKNVSVFDATDDAGEPAQSGEAATWLSGHGFNVNTISYATTDIDYTTLVTKALSSNPDGVVVGGSPSSGIALAKELRGQGYTKPVILTSELIAGNFIQLLGSAAENIYGYVPFFIDPANASAEKVANEYETIAHAPMTSGAGLIYDAFLLLAAAMRKADVDNLSTTAARAAIQKAIPETGQVAFDTGKPLTFDSGGYLIGNGYLVQIKNSAETLVKSFPVN
jgi:branched-chain amino acid transport system substrate-binding protein